MAIIVQKFGGTSVGSLERIENVAEQIIKTKRQGHQVVAVLSAMSGETNRLTELANQLDPNPSPREVDMLLASGEQVSIALLSIALIKRGFSAVSLLAHQIGLQTDNRFNKARILNVDNQRMLQELQQGHIVIVAGFQGVDHEGNITTLGRGGSDTSAVAIATALQAKECQIFTDVDGVYTTDPRIDENARKLPYVSFEEMLEMASSGAKVLQSRSVEFAGNHKMPLRVLSSFTEGEGTSITFEQQADKKHPVSAITSHKDEAMICVVGIQCGEQFRSKLLILLAKVDIEIDMLTQTAKDVDKINFTFTVHQHDYQQAMLITKSLTAKFSVDELFGDNRVVKVSAIGNGMRSHSGVAAKLFECLLANNIDVYLVSAAEIKISVLVKEENLTRSVQVLHKKFQLNTII
ncbi:aspartate kinase [Thalassotalea psychrophila]|uniref:Aspartokinase n=1 Tax=Thalassotalea psychrophila TaxID=3065647 RepID=A0ABY9TRJ6_9GAMM|nr:aspartate kinase [Colwelliaceae bacterium SQ149]